MRKRRYRQRAIGFYKDKKGRTRPITKARGRSTQPRRMRVPESLTFGEFKRQGLPSLRSYVKRISNFYGVPSADIQVLFINTQGAYNASHKLILLGDEYYDSITRKTYPDFLVTLHHELGHHIYRMRTGIMRAYTTKEEEKEAWRIAEEIAGKDLSKYQSEALKQYSARLK